MMVADIKEFDVCRASKTNRKPFVAVSVSDAVKMLEAAVSALACEEKLPPRRTLVELINVRELSVSSVTLPPMSNAPKKLGPPFVPTVVGPGRLNQDAADA
jgi:hypothetical protein